MHRSQAELIRLLELAGYEARLNDSATHVFIVGRSGHEIVRIPVVSFAEDDSRPTYWTP
jgi:hypothetical protein